MATNGDVLRHLAGAPLHRAWVRNGTHQSRIPVSAGLDPDHTAPLASVPPPFSNPTAGSGRERQAVLTGAVVVGDQ
jgi:hypothetical protein